VIGDLAAGLAQGWNLIQPCVNGDPLRRERHQSPLFAIPIEITGRLGGGPFAAYSGLGLMRICVMACAGGRHFDFQFPLLGFLDAVQLRRKLQRVILPINSAPYLVHEGQQIR
jgi:hypothetical protein